MLDSELVQKLTGQSAICSSTNAISAIHITSAQIATVEANCEYAAKIFRRVHRYALFAKGHLALTTFLARWPAESWVLILAVGLTVGFLASLICIFILNAPLFLVVLAAVFPLITMFAFWPFIRPACGKQLNLRLQDAQRAAEQAKSDIRDKQAHLRGLKETLPRLQKIREILTQAEMQHCQRDRLMAIDFRGMSGSEFELFLADVFGVLGYDVQLMGKTGDHGVDLIISRQGIKIAVQAKCYAATVGNGAVQEVYSGMAYYRCQRCMAVTSSTFTNHAKTLAGSIDCQLIEGHEIPELISGGLDI